ncbi:MAG TPA: type II secretion system minor pseudopilin GspJ [Steroidobacteraceae bacterium]
MRAPRLTAGSEAARRHRGRNAGFTLIELLVALAISAIMSLLGYTALRQAINSRKQVEEQADRLLAVQQTMRIMESDFILLQPRPVRDLLGSSSVPNQPALLAGQASSFGGNSAASSTNTLAQQSAALITFTRGGWANPTGIHRPELQRVSYVIRDGKLIRQNLPELDATPNVVLAERQLLDNVDALTFRYMDASHTWQTTWPVNPALNGVSPRQLSVNPVAIEITLVLHDWGTLVRIVESCG